MTFSQKRASGSAQSHWLLSFSDLLTLVLCFFLILVAGPVQEQSQPDTSRGESQGASAQQGGSTAFEHELKTGTEIAKLSDEALKVRIPILPIDIDAGSGGLKPKALSSVKNSVDLEAYEIEHISLAVCAGENTSSEANSWFRSAGRILAIRRQLIDAKLYGKSATLAPGGPHCESEGSTQMATEGYLDFELRHIATR